MQSWCALPSSAVVLSLVICGCGEAVDSSRKAFQHDAAGKPASVEGPLKITAGDDGPPFSLASGGGVCAGQLFLADPRQSTVHQIDLTDGRRIRALGAEMKGVGSLKSPETAIPDCDSGVVYVVDAGGIVTFDTSNGAFIRRLPRCLLYTSPSPRD